MVLTSGQCACILILASTQVDDAATPLLHVYRNASHCCVIAVEFQMAQTAAPTNFVRRIPPFRLDRIPNGPGSATSLGRLCTHCTLYGDLPCGTEESRPMSTYTVIGRLNDPIIGSSSCRLARDTAPKTTKHNVYIILLIPFQRDRLMCSLCMYHLPLFLLTSSLPTPRQYDSRNGSFRLRPSTSTHHEQL
jgi:hypothetical protein